MLTEYELIGALIDSDPEELKNNKELLKLKQLIDNNQIAFGNVLKTKNKAKQFGADRCESLSKLSKIVGH